MEKRWQPGDVILCETHGSGRVEPVFIFAPIVVEDSDDCLALYHPLGQTSATSDYVWPGGRKEETPLAERVAIFQTWESSTFRTRRSPYHVLYLEPPDAMHAVWLFWDKEWSFLRWYVNLQNPYVRTDYGVRIEDCYLDIVASPDLEWRWKDADEFQALRDTGAISEDLAQARRNEGEMMIRRVEAREWPFNSHWPAWRPDPEWPVPDIAEHWPKGGYSFTLLSPG